MLIVHGLTTTVEQRDIQVNMVNSEHHMYFDVPHFTHINAKGDTFHNQCLE
jgi:hypothetical protein